MEKTKVILGIHSNLDGSESNPDITNRFYLLIDIQILKLKIILLTNTTWKETNNCSS